MLLKNMLVCVGGGGRIDSIRKGRKRDKQEKSDAPTKVQGQSILTLGKSVSSQCSTQFRSLFPCQVFWRLIPFRACCDHAYGRNILATLRGNFLSQLVLVVIINNHTSIDQRDCLIHLVLHFSFTQVTSFNQIPLLPHIAMLCLVACSETQELVVG